MDTATVTTMDTGTDTPAANASMKPVHAQLRCIPAIRTATATAESIIVKGLCGEWGWRFVVHHQTGCPVHTQVDADANHAAASQ